jgi:acetyltransferase-like isoleucine patch superfamily enzyme
MRDSNINPATDRSAIDFEPVEWLKSLSSTSHELSFPLGTVGYTLPSLQDLNFFEITSDLVIENVRFKLSPPNRNNWLVCPKDWTPPHTTVIALHNSVRNCVIVIGNSSKVYGEFNFHHHGGLIIIGEKISQTSMINARIWGMNQLVFWGNKSTSNGVNIIAQVEGKHIIIGEDCMFANNIYIRNSDMHSMMDMDSGEWLNPASSVIIEPHVWVGQDAIILKDTITGFGSVIGAKSLVNKNTPRYSLSGGVPAKVLKSRISWDRAEFPKNETRLALQEYEQTLSSLIENI